jgi:hypothetical protein
MMIPAAGSIANCFTSGPGLRAVGQDGMRLHPALARSSRQSALGTRTGRRGLMQVPDFAAFDLERKLAPPTWPGPDARQVVTCWVIRSLAL